MHITLTGNLGSGKSTICKILREKYGFEIYSTGTVQRQLAAEMGLSVLEMNKLMCSDHKYDHLIDDTTARIAKENADKNLVFDSRLAWHFVEKSYKVFLSVSLEEASRRVYNDSTRGAVETYKSQDECRDQLRERAANEKMRYADIYGLNYYDFSNYDLVLDSSHATPEVLAQTIVTLAMDDRKKPQEGQMILFSPERLGNGNNAEVSHSGFYPDSVISIKEEGDDFAPASAEDEKTVAYAGENGYQFVKCVIS